MKYFVLKICTLSFFLELLAIGSIAQADVLMQHNDLNRTGWYQYETILNQSNVTPTNFGLLNRQAVDDQIYAQPLYVTGVVINGAVHNVVYVATVNNTVYAFDADNALATPYWSTNNTIPGLMVPDGNDVHASLCGFGYQDFSSSFGIVGTPVIDKSRNAIYFVSRSKDPLLVDNHPPVKLNGKYISNDWDWTSAGFFQQLHALSLSTGKDTLNSPINLDGTIAVSGAGDGSIGGMIHFDPRRGNQRGGLILSNGVVYIPYAGHCDMNYYHGWILGYNAADLKQACAYATTPNDGEGGIWMSGAGPAVDASGNFYFATGNADSLGTGTNPGDVGLRVVKAKPGGGTLTNVSSFKPLSYQAWNKADLDFGTGVLLVPGMDMLVTAHKTGNLVLLKQNTTLPLGSTFDENDPTNFLGYVSIGNGNESHSSISYFGGSTAKYVYQFSENTTLTAYPVTTSPAGLGTPINSTVLANSSPGFNGGFTSVSSNGTDPSTAIIWLTHQTPSGGELQALKADDVTQSLYSSDVLAADKLGTYSKMVCATIAGGKVFVPTFSNYLCIYGLLSNNTRCLTVVSQNKPATASSSDPAFPPAFAFDGLQTTRWAIGTGPTPASPQNLQVDLGSRFDICKVSIQWNSLGDYGTDFTIDVSDDQLTWATVTTISGNSFTKFPLINEYNENTTARFVRINFTKGGAFGTSIVEMQVFGAPANNCAPPVTTSLTATPTQNAATLQWSPVTNSTQYLVKYKSDAVQSYISRSVPATGNPVSLNISALTCGFGYTYQVQNVCVDGSISNPATFAFSTTACPGGGCSNAQRFNHGDLGDIQVPGMSCYDGATKTFTVTGAGNGIGGTGDQFQYEFTSVGIDEDVVAHVASQDNLGGNLAGVMLRDSVTDVSKFMFIGKTGDNSGIYMISRSGTGSATSSSFISKPAGADYFRVLKSGNLFSAYYAVSNLGPWIQVGSTQSILFAGPKFYPGMAVSSLIPGTLSTATFDNYLENSVLLPIQLTYFTATNINNEYASLKWETSQEENNDHFDVERSDDGIKYAKILTVKAVGNSSTVQSYSAIDNEKKKGIYFYRLKQVDLDNRYTYSPVRVVKFGSSIGPLIYPNPVRSMFTAIPGSEPIREIVIYNMQGRAVQFAMGNSSRDNLQVNIAGLSTGIYILKINTDSKFYQVKIIKE